MSKAMLNFAQQIDGLSVREIFLILMSVTSAQGNVVKFAMEQQVNNDHAVGPFILTSVCF